ncbi:MAG: DegT/DnrJ/EryC1/StrS family aminotransferase [Candidatus Altiarchaeota archaeon]|nr:DegT/DnrJ/EryC1/StrS family aminotransferase [Candidatus Altiarchaeota archaeon]
MDDMPLSKPDVSQEDIDAVAEVLKSTRLSIGPKVEEFEKSIAEYVGVEYAVAVNSGTSALHLIIKSLGLGVGDEVITTPFSFIASTNCILYEGATPVFVDIEEGTYNIDLDKMESAINDRTKAILAVDVFGRPCMWDKLEKLAKENDLSLIEDSAEALGSSYNNRMCGSFGDAGVFGFYPNKQITTGEGGMITTDSEEMQDMCKSMRNHGRDDKHLLQHDRLGYNYRLSEINSALGLSQLKRIKTLKKERHEIAELYSNELESIEGIKKPTELPGESINWFVYVIQLSDEYGGGERDEIIERMLQKNIQCGKYFPPIHLQPHIKKLLGHTEGDFPICEKTSDRTIALPFYRGITDVEARYIVENLRGFL